MNRNVRGAAQRWLAEKEPAVVVQVIESKGSAPRHAGTRMLVSAEEEIGTIGGGHLELKAIEAARSLLKHKAVPHVAHYPLGPALGQCCGGAVTLSYDPLDAEAMALWPDPEPLFHLQMYGAGHVGQAIARLLATLDCSVDWIDEREDMFPESMVGSTPWPSHIRPVSVDAVEGEVAIAPLRAFYLVLTHNHDLDLRITEAILRRGDFDYLGLIGSETKKARFIHRFEERGIEPAAIERMTCPIGIDGISGKEPEIIAMGVVAQLLLVSAAAQISTRDPNSITRFAGRLR